MGDQTAAFQSIFTTSDCQHFLEIHPPHGPREACDEWKAHIFAYEPVPSNYALITKRGQELGWEKAGFRAFPVALTSKGMIPEDGKIKFYGTFEEGR